MMNQKNKISLVLLLLFVLSFVSSVFIMSGCGPRPPLKMRDLTPTIPGDNPDDYDVYRVVSVKKDVSEKELANLMRYFTEFYLDTNKVKIYVFNDPGAVHLGISDALVATFYKNNDENTVKQDILLDQPM